MYIYSSVTFRHLLSLKNHAVHFPAVSDKMDSESDVSLGHTTSPNVTGDSNIWNGFADKYFFRQRVVI